MNLYDNCINKLESFKNVLVQANDIKRGNLYFSWIATKTDKIQAERDIQYLYNNLVNYTLRNYKISRYIYDTSSKKIKDIINNNYVLASNNYSFINNNIPFEDVILIAKHILFKRGNVVWVDFGFNIGREFGGMHPAIILKNLNDELFVLPVSSKMSLEYKKIEQKYDSLEEIVIQKNNINEIFEISKIFGFKNITRWAIITRIRKISILRLNFDGSIGSISGKDLDIISQKIKNEF